MNIVQPLDHLLTINMECIIKKNATESFLQKPGWNQKLNAKHRILYKRGNDEIII